MPDPDASYARLVREWVGRDGVTGPNPAGGNAFGAGALKVDGRIFAMLTRGRLVLKLPASRVQTLVADRTGRPLDASNGHPMKEWLTVLADDDTWSALTGEAYEFVRRR